jgi:hypothetical protein
LSFIAHVPVIITSILFSGLLIADHYSGGASKAVRIAIACVTALVALVQVLAYLMTSSVISGVTAVMITQITAAPLRPVELRVAFGVLKKRWRPFLRTVIRVTLRIVLGFFLLVVPAIVIWVRYSLYAPVVLIEGLQGKAAMRRARELASRSWRTIIIVCVLQLIIPMIVSAVVGRVKFVVNGPKNSLAQQLYQQFITLLNIFVVPLIAIVPALVYIKMKQLAGESLTSALTQIEEADDGERSAWQQRMRTRISLHTPTSQKSVTG